MHYSSARTMTHTTLFACFTLVVGALAQNATPNVTLPWGIWQGERYANDQKVCRRQLLQQQILTRRQITLFKNVRFGDEPPRFGAPAFPSWQFPGIRDPSYGPNCIQVNTSTLKNPPGGQPNFQLPRDGDAVQSEDCLFLDIYAPAHNFDSNGRPIKQLPVIVWFYGGAYAFGSKSLGGGVPLYTGQSMVAGQDYEAIFVAGNYRLGAFGWLAGSYMQDAGQPNAGLYDQALLLKWVQQYITQVGGDPNDVSAWGESAGAGSIMHHLIREGGTVDPLFKKFLVQSPAFEWSWDNSDQGTLDQVFKNFSQLAGCGSYDMNCLRARSVDVLTTANQELFNNVRPTGLFPVGPSVDGKWIQTIPALSYAASTLSPTASGIVRS
jgi:carboxylesterase type B